MEGGTGDCLPAGLDALPPVRPCQRVSELSATRAAKESGSHNGGSGSGSRAASGGSEDVSSGGCRGRGRGNGRGGGGGGRRGVGGGGVGRGSGRGPKKKWTDEERRWLYECYEWSGGVNKGGYIEKVNNLYHCREVTPRSIASLVSQLKTGCGLTEMDKSEIRQIVWEDQTKLFGWDSMHDASLDETFDGFADEDEEVVDEGDEAEELDMEDEVDMAIEIGPEVMIGGDEEGRTGTMVMDGVERNIDPKVMVVQMDTWQNGDGTVRLLTRDEKEVLTMLRKVQKDDKWEDVPNLRAMDRRKVKKEVELVEGVMHNVVRKGMDVSEVNRLLYAGGVVVAMRLGLKIGKGKKKAEMKKPRWQRRIESSIKRWRKDLSQVEEIRKGAEVNRKVREELNARYQLIDRGAVSVCTFLKNKIKAASTKIRWYEDGKTGRRQNNLFRNNQSQLYKELGGNTNGRTNESPDAAESREFWKNIWSVAEEHEKDAGWLEELRKKMEREVMAQDDVTITVEVVKAVVRRMANWKAPGPDGVRGFWFKKLTSLHGVLTDALKECLQRGEVPDWMVKGRTVLIQKDPAKGKAVSNYRPITCLPLMWKLLTGIFAEKIYDHLLMNNLLPDEQKGCRKNSRGTKDQLLIDKAVLREARMKKRWLAIAWIDYRKAYDMLPHSWILETLGMMKVAKNVETMLRGSMPKWTTELTSNGEMLGEVGIRRGIFQGDSLSPLLFVVAMIPLTMLLRKEAMGYRFGREGKKINHLLFMDDLKLFGRDETELDKLCSVVNKFSRDIRMEFGLDKCATLVLKDGKQVVRDGIELPDGKKIEEVDENGYKYLGVLEGADLMTTEMKESVRKEYFRRVKAVAKSKLYAGNLMRAVNGWAVSVVRYTAGVLEWNRKELKAMDTKTRKILTMNGAFNRRSSVDRLYMKRKDGGRGLMSVEQCVRSEEAGLREYVMASDEWMLKVVAEEMPVGETKVMYKKRVEKERMDRLMAKKLHGKFFNDMKNVADRERSWQWLKGGFVDKRTEGFVCAAQENVLTTRFYCATVLKQDVSAMCRKCGETVESVSHVVSGCKALAQTEYRRRHDKMGLRVYWEVCGKYGLKRSDKWYEEVPDPVRKSADGRYEIWWDQKVITPNALDHNRPDLVMIDRNDRKWKLVDFSVPWDKNVVNKEQEKIKKYAKLASEVSRMNSVGVEVVPIVVGALGVVTKEIGRWLERLGIGDVVGGLQTAAIIGTAAILRKVLST